MRNTERESELIQLAENLARKFKATFKSDLTFEDLVNEVVLLAYERHYQNSDKPLRKMKRVLFSTLLDKHYPKVKREIIVSGSQVNALIEGGLSDNQILDRTKLNSNELELFKQNRIDDIKVTKNVRVSREPPTISLDKIEDQYASYRDEDYKELYYDNLEAFKFLTDKEKKFIDLIFGGYDPFKLDDMDIFMEILGFKQIYMVKKFFTSLEDKLKKRSPLRKKFGA